MKKLFYCIVVFVLLCLLIPAISLLYDTGKTSKTDQNFYLVQNHETGEIMKLSPKDYIIGVVAAEMPISYNEEALKAQAVAAHTYALKQISASLSASSQAGGAYLSTDPAKFQAYISPEQLKKNWGKNYDHNYKKLSDAVGSVITTVMTYDGEPIAAAFHAISPGKTETSKNIWGTNLPYLTSVESDGDKLSPNFEQTLSLTSDEVKSAFTNKYSDLVFPEDNSEFINIQSTSEAGTVLSVSVGNKTLSGTEFREALSLKSACFTAKKTDVGYQFTTKGYGHGVGMSQYGADFMARQGSDYKEILAHYYQGVHFEEFKLK